jgi:hypothetical protein
MLLLLTSVCRPYHHHHSSHTRTAHSTPTLPFFYHILCSLKTKKVKNVSHDEFGATLGRIHMEKQDFDKLELRKTKGGKADKKAAKLARREAGEEGEDEEEEEDEEGDEEEEEDEDEGEDEDDDEDDDDDEDEEDEEEAPAAAGSGKVKGSSSSTARPGEKRGRR